MTHRLLHLGDKTYPIVKVEVTIYFLPFSNADGYLICNISFFKISKGISAHHWVRLTFPINFSTFAKSASNTVTSFNALESSCEGTRSVISSTLGPFASE
jgi:hypothetical protein